MYIKIWPLLLSLVLLASCATAQGGIAVTAQIDGSPLPSSEIMLEHQYKDTPFDALLFHAANLTELEQALIQIGEDAVLAHMANEPEITFYDLGSEIRISLSETPESACLVYRLVNKDGAPKFNNTTVDLVPAGIDGPEITFFLEPHMSSVFSSFSWNHEKGAAYQSYTLFFTIGGQAYAHSFVINTDPYNVIE